MRNHYDILGIPRAATPEQVKTAYRKLSVKFHPDKNDGELFFSDMFRQINEAYVVLSNANSKKTYDLQLYKFEHPEPIIQKVYQAPPTATPKPNYAADYDYQSKDKWEPVRKWRRHRNTMLIINGLLLFAIFVLPKKGSSGVDLPGRDTSTYQALPSVHHHKRKRQISKPTEAPREDNTDTPVAKAPSTAPTTMPATVVDTTSVTSSKVRLSNDSATVQQKKKKRGFFARLFGKKKKDSI